MAQPFGRQPLTAETRVRSRLCSYGIYGGKIALGHVFLRVLRLSLVSSITSQILRVFLPSTCCSYEKDKYVKTGNFPKRKSSFENRGELDRNARSFSFQRVNILAPELFFLILAHPVYKIPIIQEQNTLEL